MSRPIKKVAAGSRVFFRLEVRDISDDTMPLFTPANVPALELRDPNGVVKVNYSNTTEDAIGVFTYTHQTVVTDTTGIWRVRFRVIDGANEDYTPAQDAFELVP